MNYVFHPIGHGKRREGGGIKTQDQACKGSTMTPVVFAS